MNWQPVQCGPHLSTDDDWRKVGGGKQILAGISVEIVVFFFLSLLSVPRRGFQVWCCGGCSGVLTLFLVVRGGCGLLMDVAGFGSAVPMSQPAFALVCLWFSWVCCMGGAWGNLWREGCYHLIAAPWWCYGHGPWVDMLRPPSLGGSCWTRLPTGVSREFDQPFHPQTPLSAHSVTLLLLLWGVVT